MYMKEGGQEIPIAPTPLALHAALAISIAATLYLGILPGRVIEFASQSVRDLTQ